ncbi:MAG: rRNA maturation RNase YbeY [Dehalococcoidales bacterium]
MEINLTIEGEFAGCPDAGWFQHIAEQVLETQGAGSNAELGILITDQKKVQELNRAYRGEDHPTDVLSFYMTESGEESGGESERFVVAPDGIMHLGEVVISYPQAAIQAQEHRHSVNKELAVLTIHGVLHLLGYDHGKVAQKREMTAKERTILSNIILEQEKER